MRKMAYLWMNFMISARLPYSAQSAARLQPTGMKSEGTALSAKSFIARYMTLYQQLATLLESREFSY
jgi:hypothetical protein